MNFKSTEDSIDHVIETFENTISELERIKKIMLEKRDLSYTGEVLNEITNCFRNLRIDLLVIRPLREYERELYQLHKTITKLTKD